MKISIEDKIGTIKNTMEDIVEKLQYEIEKYKKKEENIKKFFNKYEINGHDELISIIIEYNNYLIKESDTLKNFKEIKHNLFICKLDFLSIKRGILRYKIIKKKSDSKINYIKNINLTNKYSNLNNKILELENEIDEWCKVPKCTKCESAFNNNNIPFDVKKYDLYQLCRKCISDKLNIIIKEKRIIKEMNEEHKNSKFINKLCSKNYVYLKFYNELYINNQEEKYDLYDPSIISEAGFNPENPYDKYKLNNLCYRSNKLIETFDEKIKFFDITESELARMGKMEFQELFNVIGEMVGYGDFDDLMVKLNIGNEDDYIPEPPEEDYFSDNDAMRFSSSMLNKQRVTKIIF
jgi:hypothetical protein